MRITYKNLWETAKPVLRINFIELNNYFKKELHKSVTFNPPTLRANEVKNRKEKGWSKRH